MKPYFRFLSVTLVYSFVLVGSTAWADPWLRSYSNRAWGNWSAGGSTPWFAGGGGTLRNGGFPGGSPYYRAPGFGRVQPGFYKGPNHGSAPRYAAPQGYGRFGTQR